jgi:tripartite-type tricarboxylate transporter receptor subunit TctC
VNRAALAVLAALALLAAPAAQSQDAFPSRPIRFIVPNPPGGGNDLLAREIGQELQKRLGQPVVIDNRPGAGGNIGADAVAKSPPDGYTILMAANTFVMNPHLVKQIPFDVQKDFTPITLAATIPIALVVNPDVPVTTVKELIAYAKANPGKLNYASPGSGAPQHLAAELFKTMAQVEMVHVPFKGAGQMVPELLAGRVQVLFGAINSLLPHMKAGKLRGLAVTGAKRTPVAPELPTVMEAGLPGYEVDIWFGILAPAGIPPEVAGKLNAEIVAVLRSPEFGQRMAVHGMEMVGTTPGEFREVIGRDLVRWGNVVKQAGIKPE